MRRCYRSFLWSAFCVGFRNTHTYLCTFTYRYMHTYTYPYACIYINILKQSSNQPLYVKLETPAPKSVASASRNRNTASV